VPGYQFTLLKEVETVKTQLVLHTPQVFLTLQVYVRAKLSALTLREKRDLFSGKLSNAVALRASSASKIQGLQRMADARDVLDKRMFEKSMLFNQETNSSKDQLEVYAATKIQGMARSRSAKNKVASVKEALAERLLADTQELSAAAIQKQYKQYQQNSQEIAAAKDKLEALRLKREEERKKKVESESERSVSK